MSTAIVLPELGVRNQPIRVSEWLVEPGEAVSAGDRVVEVLVQGITFDVPAPASGMLTRIERARDTEVSAGDVLGWIA
jgi:pyruvate/2-oxoglutarate dehydrogenase complex dihydrolipoamide acyltransferase (E2) component